MRGIAAIAVGSYIVLLIRYPKARKVSLEILKWVFRLLGMLDWPSKQDGEKEKNITENDKTIKRSRRQDGGGDDPSRAQSRPLERRRYSAQRRHNPPVDIHDNPKYNMKVKAIYVVLVMVAMIFLAGCDSLLCSILSGDTCHSTDDDRDEGSVCSTHSQCAGALLCDRQRCSPPASCRFASDCGGGLMCAAGYCSDGGAGSQCDRDRECVDSLRCRAGYCSDGSTGSVCESDFDCASARICAAGRCSDGSPGSACDSDRHCGYACVSDVCTDGRAGKACNSDDQCFGSLFCASGHCSDGSVGSMCSNDSHCNDTLVCTSSFFAGQCTDGSAGSPCGSSSHCDFLCVSAICTAGTVGSTCHTDGNCKDGLICFAETCRVSNGSVGSVCVNDNHCDYACDDGGSGRGGACTDGSADSACRDSSHCVYACTGGDCTAGTVGSVCGTDTHCEGSLVCQSRRCQ